MKKHAVTIIVSLICSAIACTATRFMTLLETSAVQQEQISALNKHVDALDKQAGKTSDRLQWLWDYAGSIQTASDEVRAKNGLGPTAMPAWRAHKPD